MKLLAQSDPAATEVIRRLRRFYRDRRFKPTKHAKNTKVVEALAMTSGC
jgi:hypothetical protein